MQERYAVFFAVRLILAHRKGHKALMKGSECMHAQLVPMPLQDSLMPLSDAILSLSEAMRAKLREKPYQFGIAFNIMAGVAGKLASGSDGRMWPMPVELYSTYQQAARSSVELPPKAKDADQDTWTLLLCCEDALGWGRGSEKRPLKPNVIAKPPSRFTGNQIRYAFVARNCEGGIEAVGSEEFLSRVGIENPSATDGSLANVFHTRLSRAKPDVPALKICSVAEAEEAMKAAKMYNQRIDESLLRMIDINYSSEVLRRYEPNAVTAVREGVADRYSTKYGRTLEWSPSRSLRPVLE